MRHPKPPPLPPGEDGERSEPGEGLRRKKVYPRPTVAMALLAAIVLVATGPPAAAQRKEPKPAILEGVDVTEHPNVQIPLDLEFFDSKGKKVLLGKYFDGTRPVILTLNYSDCPKLCSVQLNGLVDAMKNMTWDAGDQYDVVTVSIDPLETTDRARLTKQSYVQKYARPGGGEGWHFLVGRQEEITKLADTVGFGYRLVDKQYIHAAVLFVCTPDGRVSRYIYKVEYDPQTLRLSLYEAGQGKVGSPMDQVLLYCFHYDPSTGRYGPEAFNLMRAGGALTVVVLGAMLSVYWLREKRKTKRPTRRDNA
jgi:protein SCO1/2